MIKKTLLEAYSRPRQNGVNAITLREDDGLIQVCMTNGNNEVIIANRNGRAIRFHESAVRVMGRTASGVKGMTLDEDNTCLLYTSLFGGLIGRNRESASGCI